MAPESHPPVHILPDSGGAGKVKKERGGPGQGMDPEQAPHGPEAAMHPPARVHDVERLREGFGAKAVGSEESVRRLGDSHEAQAPEDVEPLQAPARGEAEGTGVVEENREGHG